MPLCIRSKQFIIEVNEPKVKTEWKLNWSLFNPNEWKKDPPCLVSLSPSRSVPGDECEDAAELDAILQHHHSVQEKLAEDMLHLARNLKNNTLAVQNIIKQDNQVSHTVLPHLPECGGGGFFDSNNPVESLNMLKQPANQKHAFHIIYLKCNDTCIKLNLTDFQLKLSS